MIRRLRHFFSGHNWITASAVFNKPVGCAILPTYVEQWRAAVGFTVILRTCPCGKTKTLTLLGDHTGVKAQGELEALNRMMR